jgi:hypothetical protein
MNQQPKINDKFRFDDGTIGTIVNIHTHVTFTKIVPVIEVNSRKFGYSTFAIADLTLCEPGTGATLPNYWTVKG